MQSLNLSPTSVWSGWAFLLRAYVSKPEESHGVRQDQRRPGTPAVTPHRCWTSRAHPPPTLQNPCLLIFASVCSLCISEVYLRKLCLATFTDEKTEAERQEIPCPTTDNRQTAILPQGHAPSPSTIQPGFRNSSNCFSHELVHSEGRLSVIKMSCAAHPGNRC